MLKSPLFWKMTTLFGAVLLLLIPIMLIRQKLASQVFRRNGKAAGLLIISVSVLLQAMIPAGKTSPRLASQ